jgi:trimeric autotransporter adhesin
VSSLVNNWTSIAKTQTTTSLTLSPTTFQHGTVAAIGISVNPSSATGNVALSTDATVKTGSSSNARISFSLSSGRATGSWAGLPGGTYDVFANYGGDGSYGGSVSAPTQITVTPEDSILQLSVSAAGANGKLANIAGGTVTYGTYVSVDAQPIGKSQAGSTNPIRNATGTVVSATAILLDRKALRWRTRAETWSFLLITAFRLEHIPSRLLITGI